MEDGKRSRQGRRLLAFHQGEFRRKRVFRKRGKKFAELGKRKGRVGKMGGGHNYNITNLARFGQTLEKKGRGQKGPGRRSSMMGLS